MPGKLTSLAAVSIALLAGAGRAAELGEVSVRSHIGQQLSADVELVDLSGAELADLQARLARPDVFLGASVRMNPALAGLNIAVVKRDQRRVLHLTTLQPVNAEILHIFLEIGSSNRQVVRSATLWLTPEPPQPQRAVAAAPTASPAPAPAPLAATAATPAPAPAPAVPPAAVVTVAAMPMPLAPTPAPAKPAKPAPAAEPTNEAALNAAAERAFVSRSRPSAPVVAQAPAPVRRPAAAPAAAPAACAPVQPDPDVQACAALDASTKVLTTKLVDLEGKVKVLQTALATTAAPVAAAPAPAALPASAKASAAASNPSTAASASSASAAVAAPVAQASTPPASAAARASASQPAKPARASAAGSAASAASDPSNGGKKMSRPKFITMIAGGSVLGLLLIGVAVHFVRKQRAKGRLKIWQGFRKKKSEDHVEPNMEEASEAPVAVTAQE